MRAPDGRWLLVAAMLLLLSATARRAGAVPEVAEQRDVSVEDARLLGLSPDGRWLLGERDEPDRRCSFDATTLAERACADLEAAGYGGPIQVESVAWSPDGDRVAFTENAARYFFESDVWVFDLTGGTPTNLTDDGASGSLITAPSPSFVLDLWPAWAPDGQSIAFARGAYDGSAPREVGLYRVATTGGTPERLLDLPVDLPLAVYPALRWTADGQRLVYSLWLSDERAGEETNGLWVADLAGGATRRLVAADGEVVPLLVDVSTRDQALVLLSGQEITAAADSTTDAYALVDLETGATTPLAAPDVTAYHWRTLALVAFAPDGSALLYVARGSDRQRALRLLDLATGEATTLLERVEAWAGGREPLGLGWATNGIVFVPGFGGDGTLLRLADAAASPAAATPAA